MSAAPPIHASCVAIAGRGVLIAGRSGAGKSDLALRLVDRGAVLVSDDYTLLHPQAGRLIANPPERIAGRIELRGVGIVERPFVADAPVALLIDLDLKPVRHPEAQNREILGIPLPLIGLDALEPSAPIKVEAALTLFGIPA